MKKFSVMAAAWLEIIVGFSCVAMPDVLCRLLFAATPEGITLLFARFAGVALLGLGIACMPSKLTEPRWSAALGLLVFNVGATVFFAWVGVATMFRGILLWPVVILHAVIAACLIRVLLIGQPLRP